MSVIEVRTGGTELTVTLALTFLVPFVAFTRADPACNALKVTEAFPSGPVNAYAGDTVPTVVLLLLNDMLTPDIGTVLFNAVALNV